MAEKRLTEAVPDAGSPPSNDWWMYHADERHSGNAAGPSAIRSASVQKLVSRHVIQLDHAIISVPAIVGGCIYVGTRSGNNGGHSIRLTLLRERSLAPLQCPLPVEGPDNLVLDQRLLLSGVACIVRAGWQSLLRRCRDDEAGVGDRFSSPRSGTPSADELAPSCVLDLSPCRQWQGLRRVRARRG